MDKTQLSLQERLAKIGANVPGFIASFRRRPDGSYTMPFATPATEDLYGLSPETLAVDMTAWADNIHPEDFEALNTSIVESSRTGERWHHVFRYRHPTRGLRWIEGWAAPEPEPDGSTIWHGFVMDVTDRKLAEQRVVRLSDLYRTLTNVNQAIVRAKDETELFQRVCDVLIGLGGLLLVQLAPHDPRRNVLAHGAAAGRFVGALTGQEVPLDLDGPSAIRPAYQAFHRGEAVALHDTRATAPVDPWSRQLLEIGVGSVICLPFRRGGQVAGVLGMAAREPGYFDAEVVRLLEGTVENISFGLDSLASAAALREKEEQLHFAQRMEAIGRLAGGVAHDFNNLLMVIGSYTELAMDSVQPEAPLFADLDEIRKATVRATALTRQLIAFGRKQVLRPQVLNLNQLVSGMEAMLRRVLTPAIGLTFAPEAALGRTKADPAQLENVIMNLAINARDAMPSGGTLTIRTSEIEVGASEVDHYGCPKPGPYVMLSISDTGTGMDEATLARVFEPFFTTKPTGKGTGLGLATVYGIIAQSGGSVRADSAVGKGSTFEILLPREESRETDDSRPAPAPAVPRGAGTILIAEDEDAVRKITSRILTKAGYKVIAAANGGEALLACQTYTSEIKLMLTDVVMPGMNGSELAARAAPLRPAMKVLFMSGYTGDAILHDGILPQGTQLISKPFSAETLLTKIRSLLDPA